MRYRRTYVLNNCLHSQRYSPIYLSIYIICLDVLETSVNSSEDEVIEVVVSFDDDGENEAVEDNVVEANVVENNVVEANVVENNVVENNVVENNVVENNVVDNEVINNEGTEKDGVDESIVDTNDKPETPAEGLLQVRRHIHTMINFYSHFCLISL